MRNVSVLIFAVVVLHAGFAHSTTTYTVKKGDTLSEIARQFGVPLSKLQHANKIRAKTLQEGKRLIIPECTAGQKRTVGESPRTASSPDGSASLHRNTSHVVRKGETLGKIARRYSVSEDALRSMNALSSDKLRAGQRLVVKEFHPASYTVKRGDSIEKIARKVRIDAAEIREINGLRSDVLKPGQTLRLARMPQDPSTDQDRPAETPGDDRAAGHASVAMKHDGSPDTPESQDISQMDLRDRLILFARKMLDLPYRFGGNGLFGIDCSAFVQRTFGAVGIALPRSAREQFEVGTEIDKEDLSVGDLVFFRTYASFPSHVGIYLGNNFFIHASSKSKKVTIDSLDRPYYLSRFIGARRLVGDDNNLAGFVE